MYIGLDIGTSGTKAALIDQKGNTLKIWKKNYGFSNMDKGKRELNVQIIWEAVKECLKRVGSNSEVQTITVSSLGEAIIFVDKTGRIISDSITGTDVRGTVELQDLESRFGIKKLISITGLNLSSIYSANKILWVKKNKPELYDSAWKIFTFQDFIIFRLCGETVMDQSMASRTLLYDIQRKEWSKEILKGIGVEREKLSQVKMAGTVVGVLKRSLIDEFGINGMPKIILGTHDHICNALGCGVYKEGDCANTVGTTEGITAVLQKKQLSDKNIEKYQVSCEPFIQKDLYNTVAWNNTSGAMLRWFVQEMMKDKQSEGIENIYAQLNKEMPSSPTGLLVLPHFSGAATPYMDSKAKGVILGLTLNTKQSEIYKALIEGANYELALIIDNLKMAGLKLDNVVATGGALSVELLQIKTNILGIPVHTVKNNQTGVLGGAILGSVAIGQFKNLEESVDNMVKPGRVYFPDEKEKKKYYEILNVYKQVYPAVSNICHQL